MKRYARLRKILENQRIDAICIRDTSHIAYLTGFVQRL